MQLFDELTLTSLLSFGPDTQPLHLEPLNVLIGPNGSGKSNLIEAISLLRSAPAELVVPVREGGGVGADAHPRQPGIDHVHPTAAGPRAQRRRVV